VPEPQKHDFSLRLTRVIEPKEGPGSSWRPWRMLPGSWAHAAVEAATAALGVCSRVLIAATTGDEADIERATAQMERALRRDNWL
jgi:hypothetical protein